MINRVFAILATFIKCWCYWNLILLNRIDFKGYILWKTQGVKFDNLNNRLHVSIEPILFHVN